MKKIFCTGAQGQLGSALVNLGCIPFEADVLKFDDVQQEMLEKSPDVLIHCVGLNVDASQEDYEKAAHLAIFGTSNIIDMGINPHTRCIYISSSHIFDGKKGKYREQDRPNPINDYGLIKLSAEQVARISGAKIIRLSTCFHMHHKDIQHWRRMANSGFGFEVPTFIRRSYAHVEHVAKGIMEFANRWEMMPQVMNIAGTEDLSMYEFALTVAAYYGWDKNLIEPRRKEVVMNGQAPRPHKATLNMGLAKKYNIPLFSVYDGVDLL